MANPRPPIMAYFQFTHLPAGPLQEVSCRFSKLAYELYTTLPAGPELSVALRKLLESKDAAVRAALGAPTSGDFVAEHTNWDMIGPGE
ncbi:hypothetical protein [Streptomyces paromomycinus]|uniref:Uncharacterized protein n=1 Tax=Streptomyces paromomycinus TaxID=92743 RepID=A0A401W9U6_STREY|nr:hypothetical protein [Streptomyces paromomycinus]GCD46125.1 hypothetical protein GKJPGBOP_05872 [Streptomyces paromomycinus]